MSETTPEPKTPALIDPSESIEELFSRDPNKWTDQDLDAIVQRLRSQRGKFILEEQKKANTEKKPRAPKSLATPATGAAKPSGSFSLESLGLLSKPDITPGESS